MSTEDVEGVRVEHPSEAIEGGFVPAKMEGGLFIIREGSIGSSEDVVKPRAAVQRVDSVRFESDNIRGRCGRVVIGSAPDYREKPCGCGADVDESEGGSQKYGQVCKKHGEEINTSRSSATGGYRLSGKKGKKEKSARREGIVKEDREGLVALEEVKGNESCTDEPSREQRESKARERGREERRGAGRREGKRG